MKALTRRPLQELESEERVERQEEEDSSQGTKWLTTKFVLRFRNKRWIRRARLVARELRTQEQRTTRFRQPRVHRWYA